MNAIDPIARLTADRHLNTPHIVYVEEVFLRWLHCLRSAFEDGAGFEPKVYLAIKSCYCRAILQTAVRENCGAEVMSSMEYRLARECGFPADRILVNGLARSRAFLEQAAREGACIFVETEHDVRNVAELGQSMPVRAGVRIRPRLDERTKSPYASPDSKLALDPASAYFDEVIAQLTASPGVRFDAVHCHFTINAKDASIYEDVLAQLAGFLVGIEERVGRIEAVDIGGGYGTFRNDEGELAASMFHRIGAAVRQSLPDRELWMEPGRYLTNPCGFMIATVLDRRPLANGKTLLVTDAGTNVLIPIQSARYEIVSPKTTTNGFRVMIADGISSPDNVVVPDAALERLPEVGERIILGNVGAYTTVFSHFWAFEPCTVGFMDAAGNHRELITQSDIAACRQRFLGF